MQAKLREIKEALRRCMHQPIPEQGKWLGRVVRGYFNYHAVPTNARALDVFRHHVTDLWQPTLRRSHKDRITRARMTRLADDSLPKPKILRPWPYQRFAVTHPRWESDAGSVRRSWYELASASLARPKPGKQDGSEPCVTVTGRAKRG
jgi:hypothetical protein